MIKNLLYQEEIEMSPKNTKSKINADSGSNGDAPVQALAREGVSIPRLRAMLKGQVIAPGDAGYDQAQDRILRRD